MSSVSSKTTSGQDDGVRAARDEYRKKEAELIKKHNKEIRALSDRYTQEIDNMDRTNSGNLKAVREKTQDALTDRDVRYQGEMDGMRKMNTQQLEKLMQENKVQLESERKAAKSEIKQSSLGKTDRVDTLNERYQRELAENEKNFSESLEKLRVEQQGGLKNTREELNEKHEKELTAVKEDRDEKVVDLKNQYNTLRETTAERLKRQDVKHMQETHRQDAAQMDMLRQEAESHNKVQENSREGYQEGLMQLRDRYAKANEKQMAAQNEVGGEFQSRINDRVNNQVNRLQQEVVAEKNKNVRSNSDVRLEAKHEIKDVRDDYQKKFDYLEKARQETLRQSNDINAQNVKEIHDGAEKEMKQNSEYYLSRMQMENFKNRQAVGNMTADFKVRDDYKDQTTDQRIEHMRQSSDSNEVKLRDVFQANIDALKASSDEKNRDLTMAHEKDKSETVIGMKSQIEKGEMVHAIKTNDIISKYEKRVGEMNDMAVREKRLRDNRERQLIKEMKRQHENEIDALKAKYEDKAKQSEMAHDRDLKAESQRQQGKLDEVLSTVKKSQS